MTNRILPYLANGDGASDGPPVRGPRSEWRRGRGVYFASVSHFSVGPFLCALDLCVCKQAAWESHRAGHRDRFQLADDAPWQLYRLGRGRLVVAILIRTQLGAWDRELMARQAKGGAR